MARSDYGGDEGEERALKRVARSDYDGDEGEERRR